MQLLFKFLMTCGVASERKSRTLKAVTFSKLYYVHIEWDLKMIRKLLFFLNLLLLLYYPNNIPDSARLTMNGTLLPYALGRWGIPVNRCTMYLKCILAETVWIKRKKIQSSIICARRTFEAFRERIVGNCKDANRRHIRKISKYIAPKAPKDGWFSNKKSCKYAIIYKYFNVAGTLVSTEKVVGWILQKIPNKFTSRYILQVK